MGRCVGQREYKKGRPKWFQRRRENSSEERKGAACFPDLDKGRAAAAIPGLFKILSVANRPRFGSDSQARILQLDRWGDSGAQLGKYQLNGTVRAGHSADSISL